MLNEMFSPEWLENTARDVGLIKREQKIDSVTLFWVLVLGFGIGFQRTLASLRRAYQTASTKKLAPSAFYDRFTPQLAAFFRECLAHGIADIAGQISLPLSEKLQGFKDIIVSDGTVIRLHEQLAEQFPGTRGKAELKIHAAVGITGNTKSVAIYSGNTADVKTMRIGPWVKDNLLLFDLGDVDPGGQPQDIEFCAVLCLARRKTPLHTPALGGIVLQHSFYPVGRRTRSCGSQRRPLFAALLLHGRRH